MKRYKLRLVASAVPWLFSAWMVWVLFTQPRLFHQIVATVIAAGFVTVTLIGMTLGYLTMARGAGAQGHERSKEAYVGMRGSGVPLRLTDLPNGAMKIEWAPRNYLILLAGLVILGPGLIVSQALFPSLVVQPVWIVSTILLPLIEFGAVVLLVYGLRYWATQRHMMLVDQEAITLLAGRTIMGRFERAELAGVRIDVETYRHQDDGVEHSCENYLVVVQLATGAEERFCISDNRDQIKLIAVAIQSRLGVPMS